MEQMRKDVPEKGELPDDATGARGGSGAKDEPARGVAFRHLPRLLKVLVGPSWGSLVALVIFQVFAGITPSLAVWLNSIVIDKIVRVGGKSPHELLAYSVLLLAVVVTLLNALGNVLEASESLVGDTFMDRARKNMSFRINEKIAKHPLLTFFDDPKLNSLVVLARRSLDSVDELIHLSSYTLVGIFGVIPALILAATLKWWIPMVVVSSMLPLLYAKAINERKSWDIESYHASTFNQLQLGERMLTHQEFAKDLRLFAMQGWILRRWGDLYQSFLKDLIAVRKRGACQISLWSILSGMGVSVPFVYVVNGALQGNFTVGDLSLLIGVIVQIRSGLAAIIYNGGDIMGTLLATGPLTELLNLPEQQEKVERSEGERSAAPGIRLEDVCFRYANGAEFVLEGVNLSIAAGERFAIVGENGSGKSTLAKLFCGFYRPTSGQIQWNGSVVDLASEEKHRKRISAVFQDHAKFPLSVRENVDARRTGASDDDIRMVLKKVGLDELMGDLDRVLWKGIEGGTELSGGHWQRLAVARALLNANAADLLIFDEPTSALDPDAEHEVIQLIREMMNGRTSIVISHRLALTRCVDQIVVLEKGHIVERGSHRELMDLKGRYHAMFTRQASYYVD